MQDRWSQTHASRVSRPCFRDFQGGCEVPSVSCLLCGTPSLSLFTTAVLLSVPTGVPLVPTRYVVMFQGMKRQKGEARHRFLRRDTRDLKNKTSILDRLSATL